jgi:hypothetical protein
MFVTVLPIHPFVQLFSCTFMFVTVLPIHPFVQLFSCTLVIVKSLRDLTGNQS